ncbi:MAG: SRPBCC family protein [Planctomycetota bacterium]
MTTRAHALEIFLPASPERVFALLHTPSDIRWWWSAARVVVIPEPGGIWAAAWGDDEDDPDYVTVATMKVFDPPRRIVMDDFRYRARSGTMPFDAVFTTMFEVEPAEGGCRLRVTQDGFPADPVADDFYEACERGWCDTLEAIRRLVEG